MKKSFRVTLSLYLIVLSVVSLLSLALNCEAWSQGSYQFVMEWGSFGTLDGQFNYPMGVAVDLDGSVYVADTNNVRIEKFTSTGAFITKWGSRGTGNGQFSSIAGIAVDPWGNVYVTDSSNNCVQKFTSTGAFITRWGTLGELDGQFHWPEGIAVDASGNVYVVDIFNNRVQRFDSTGGFITKWGVIGGDIAVDSSGFVYVAVLTTVTKFDPVGTIIDQWSLSGMPGGIAVASSGSVYVSTWARNRIQVFALFSSVLYADFGSDGTWLWSGGTWSKLTSSNPENMVASGSLLYVDFGIAGGLWVYNGSNWSKLTSSNPENMLAP